MKLVCQTDELLQHWVISPQERNLALNDRNGCQRYLISSAAQVGAV